MRERNMDEMISHFNRKVANMDIDQKYKMELLGMITAIGIAAEKESAKPDVSDTNVGNIINRQDAIDALAEDMPRPYTPDGSHPADDGIFMAQEIYADCIETLKLLPSAQPEPISEEYARAVFAWLLDYQIKAAELEGRYTPYEVLSWVANDWRKEHERLNQ